jgi:mersacidin/lichenicidin family type 2 lantibiotic
MSIQDIIRAWKDGNYRDSLSEEQQALLPENPIGEPLSQEDLLSVNGGLPPVWTGFTGSCKEGVITCPGND